jgi:transcriptional regulator with XRE-family HTH domain
MTTKTKSAVMRALEATVGGPLSFGALIEAIRLSEEESLAIFARRLGISRSHLCDIEKCRKTVSPERAARFASVLGYSLEQFVRLALQDQVKQAGLHLKVHVEAA